MQAIMRTKLAVTLPWMTQLTSSSSLQDYPINQRTTTDDLPFENNINFTQADGTIKHIPEGSNREHNQITIYHNQMRRKIIAGHLTNLTNTLTQDP